jgi:hypothetical protein
VGNGREMCWYASSRFHMRDIVVVMTDKPTDVTFHVTDEQGTPTREYVGLLFAADKQKWMDNSGRYIRTLVPPVDVSPDRRAPRSPRAASAERSPRIPLAHTFRNLSRRTRDCIRLTWEFCPLDSVVYDHHRHRKQLEQPHRRSTSFPIALELEAPHQQRPAERTIRRE